MKKILLPLFILLALTVTAQTPGIEISTKNNTERENKTAALLKAVLSEYDLSKWVFTDKIIIQERVIPHSHPVLTLSTGSTDKKELMAGFIHEQLHWYMEKNPKPQEKAIAEFRKRYKNVPYANRAGAKDEYSTYMHLINCFLEYRIMASLIGEEEAKQMMWNTSYYTWVYNKVVEEKDIIEKIVKDAGYELGLSKT
jgi:hypothetical protein